MRKLFHFLPLILMLVVLTALGWQLAMQGNPAMQTTLKSAPAISLPSVMHEGTALENSDFGAKVNIVNVFASWCTPCIAELPLLAQISQVPGVKIYGIAWHDKEETLQAWIKKYSPPFTDIGSDQDGQASIALGIRGVPESFFFDQKGNVIYHHAGVITSHDLKETILPLIRKHTGSAL